MSALKSFFKQAGKLRHLKRTGWIKNGISTSKSVADHTFRIALLTLTLGFLKQLRGQVINLEKALSLSLLHDLPESSMGDLDPETKKILSNDKIQES